MEKHTIHDTVSIVGIARCIADECKEELELFGALYQTSGQRFWEHECKSLVIVNNEIYDD